MEDLVTMASQIKEPRHPPLGNSGNVKHSPGDVEQPHGSLVCKRDIPLRLVPVDDEGMDSRDEARESHRHEQAGAEGPVFAGGEGGGEEGDDGADAHDSDSSEVHNLPVWGALENVVNWWEE